MMSSGGCPPCGRWPIRRWRPRSNGPTRPRSRTRWRSLRSMPCSPGPGRKGSGRSTSEAWSPLRSPTATAGPGPGSPHPRRGREQGADPRRTLAVHRRAGAVQGQRRSVGDLQHRAGAAPPRHVGGAVRRTARHRPGKRPIREIVGVDPRLNQRWSTRRAHINTRRGELAIQFQNDHGRPPTPVEALHLAQQATLETRDAKHEPRSLAEQRATWLNEAAAVLGGRGASPRWCRQCWPRRPKPPRSPTHTGSQRPLITS